MPKNGILIENNTSSGESRRSRGAGCLQTLLQKERDDFLSLVFFRAVFAEFVGTFVLCTWTIGSGYTPHGGDPPALVASALGTGLLVACIITVLLNVSGGHINPAISIGFLVTGQITLIRFIFYVLAQCCASITAVLLVRFLTPEAANDYVGLILPGPGITSEQAFVSEMLIDFMLLFGTIGMVDTARKDVVGPVPFFVGLIVAANIIFSANISGGCMNPARNFGPAIISGNTKLQWVYWLGPLIGGALGALLYDKVLSDKAVCSCSRPRGQRLPDQEHAPAETDVMLQDVQ